MEKSSLDDSPQFRYTGDEVKEPYHYKMCGLDDIYLVSGYKFEDTAYGRGVVIQNMKGLHCAIGKFIVKCKKTLNAKEVRYLRHEMDLTQAELGDLLRVTDQTVARWEKGETSIPGPADLLLRNFYLTHIDMDFDLRELVKELREQDAPTRERLLFSPTAKGWKSETTCAYAY